MRPAAALLALLAALAPAAPAAADKVFVNASDQFSNPVSCGGNEAQYAADQALRTQAKLEGYGFEVQYSQDFYDSPDLANNWGAERFLSVHTNAGGGHGTETLYKSSAGNTLAGHINAGIVAQLGFANRGLKYRDDLYMLNATDMPAALTEVLFHDCTTVHSTPIGSMSESCFLTEEAGRDLAAEGMAQGFCAHFGVTCTAAPPLPDYDASAGASSFPATLAAGEEAVVWFEFVNQGSATWGTDATRLGTQDPQDRDSAFFVDGNWLSPSRASGADHSDYATGATGRFTFAVRAPAVEVETTFTETFQLVEEGVSWFGPRVTMSITVTPGAEPGDPPSGPVNPGDQGLGGDDDGLWITGGCALAGGSGAGAPLSLLMGWALLALGARRRRRR